jgi:HlyD family secretion protein
MPIPVEGAPVLRDTLVLSVSAAGQAASFRATTLRAQVSGQVRAVRVRENTAAGAGQLLIEIDPEEYQLNLREAEASYARTEASYREQLVFDDRIADGAVRAERERNARARTGLDVAQVAVEKARLNLARTRVRAPFAGRIANVQVVPGQHVAAGEELLTVQLMDPLEVEVQVLEGEIGFISPGRAAALAFAAFPGEQFQGTVQTVNPVVDQKTRTARVSVAVRNPQGRLLPGMYARVALAAQRLPDRMLVPVAAILERDDRTLLFVFEGEGDNGRAKWRYVTTGLRNDTHVEIVEHPETELVRAGEMVLIDGHQSLVHDARVRLTENAAAEGGRPQ